MNLLRDKRLLDLICVVQERQVAGALIKIDLRCVCAPV